MSQYGLRVPVKTLALVASAARTASGNSGAIVLQDTNFSNVGIKLTCTPVTGTTPTLDLYIQESIDGGTNFIDMAHFAQVTAALTNPTWVSLAVGGSDRYVGAVGDAVISASGVGAPLVSNVWRVKWVIGGTNPSFTFQVDAFLG